MYDPELDKWTVKANMPSAQLGLSTTAINGKIYAIFFKLTHSLPILLDLLNFYVIIKMGLCIQ